MADALEGCGCEFHLHLRAESGVCRVEPVSAGRRVRPALLPTVLACDARCCGCIPRSVERAGNEHNRAADGWRLWRDGHSFGVSVVWTLFRSRAVCRASDDESADV